VTRFTVPLLLAIALQTSLPQTGSSWLFPTDEALLSVAKRGYEGAKPKPILARVKFWDCFFKEAECAIRVQIAPPIQRAIELGAEKKKTSEPLPSDQEILRLRGQVVFDIILGARTEKPVKELILTQGGKALHPTEETIYRSALPPCNAVGDVFLSSSNCKELEIRYRFDFEPGAETPTGKETLILRWVNGKEQRVKVDFAKLSPPQSTRH
jgi:hypothetical protein